MAVIDWGAAVTINDPFRGAVIIDTSEKVIEFFQEREGRLVQSAKWSGIFSRFLAATSGGRSGVDRMILLAALRQEGLSCD